MQFLAMLALAAFVAGCVGNNSKKGVRELKMDEDAELIDFIEAFGGMGIPFPEGSTVDMDAEDVFCIKLPEGYTYLLSCGDGDAAVLRESEVLGVRCTCDEGSGCYPVTCNGNFYCVMTSDCSSCTRELIWKDNTGGQDKGDECSVAILGMINRNAGITLLCETDLPEPNDEIEEMVENKLIRGKDVIHGNAFPELFEVADVIKTMEDKFGFVAEKGLEPNALACLNVYGNIVLAPFWFENDFVIFEKGDVKYEAIAVSKDKPSEFERICELSSVSKVGYELEEIDVPFLGTGYRCKTDGGMFFTIFSVE